MAGRALRASTRRGTDPGGGFLKGVFFEEETYCPAVDHHEGLRLRVETAVGDGLWPAGDEVAHVVLRDLGGAQGELGHDVGVVGDPPSRGGQGGAGQRGVRCCQPEAQKRCKI